MWAAPAECHIDFTSVTSWVVATGSMEDCLEWPRLAATVGTHRQASSDDLAWRLHDSPAKAVPSKEDKSIRVKKDLFDFDPPQVISWNTPHSSQPHAQFLAPQVTHGGHVRRHTKVFLGSTVGDTEASHDFIKDQQSTVLGGQLPKANQEFLGGWNETRVAHHWLKDYCSHLVGLKELLQVHAQAKAAEQKGTVRNYLLIT